MAKLRRNHPFIIEAFALEDLEAKKGLTEEIIRRRIKMARRYPEYYKEYMEAKERKQDERIYREKIDKRKEIKERGCEAISYYKKRIEEIKRKNRLNSA